MKRPVFDTNVLFAAQATNGVCAALYRATLRIGRPLISHAILAELEEKLESKLSLSLNEAARVRAAIESECEVVPVVPLQEPVCRDHDDDMVLGTALGGNADVIVTGDKDLLVLKSYNGIPILTPAEFFARLQTDPSL